MHIMPWTRSIGLLVALTLLLAFASNHASQPVSATAASSLPSVSSGARPGPDVLYAPAPAAPQLENRNPRFSASPLLVSGTEAYVNGEYLYQDYLYDDYGSNTNGSGGTPLSPRAGDINYPTNNARYGGNAADLVEFRIDVAPDSVAYRLTLNTLLESDSTIVAIAFDTDRDQASGGSILSRDPGAPFPGTDEVIFTWGTGAEHARWNGIGWTTTPLATPSTDLEANQITVTVPRSVSNPAGSWRATLATGLYDPTTGGWLRPQQNADAGTPGGAGGVDPTPAGIFNLGFRFNEPVLSRDTPPDTNQSTAIRNKQPTQYAHDIDFTALAARMNSSTVPSSGLQIRIFPSRLQLGEGQDINAYPAYRGQLQPYSLYVPTTYDPGTPAGFVLALHSLDEHYWQYNGTMLHQQFGEQRGAIVATSLSRARDGWYRDYAEYDVFEMWNDVAAHFNLDGERTVLTGYSMGGYATYRLGTFYPDLFGKAFSVVGPPGEGIWVPPAPPTGGTRGGQTGDSNGAAETLTNNWLENTRNLPYMNLAGTQDELVPYAGPEAQNLGRPDLGINGFDQLGYRFHFLTFNVSDHLALAALGYNFPMARGFLGDAFVDRNPAHVTFSYSPAADCDSASADSRCASPSLGLRHDHAYWVSGLTLANPTKTPFPAEGTIDARTHAYGVSDPLSTAGQRQCSTPGNPPDCGPLPYTEFNRTWGPAPAIPVANQLDITLTNLSDVTVDAARAGLVHCEAVTLSIYSDSATRLLLAGDFPGATVSGAASEQTPEGIALLVQAGHSDVTITPCDSDGDGRPDPNDNCPNTPNPTQSDIDGDGIGDACDPDRDGDGVPNASDNCPNDANPTQTDSDGDGFGDVCDHDVRVSKFSTGGRDMTLGTSASIDRQVLARCQNLSPHTDIVRCTVEIAGLPSGCTAQNLDSGLTASAPGGLVMDNTSSYAPSQERKFDFKLHIACAPRPPQTGIALIARADHGADDGLGPDDEDTSPANNRVTRLHTLR